MRRAASLRPRPPLRQQCRMRVWRLLYMWGAQVDFVGTYNVFQVAARCNVPRIAYASRAGVMGGWKGAIAEDATRTVEMPVRSPAPCPPRTRRRAPVPASSLDQALTRRPFWAFSSKLWHLLRRAGFPNRGAFSASLALNMRASRTPAVYVRCGRASAERGGAGRPSRWGSTLCPRSSGRCSSRGRACHYVLIFI